MTSPNHLLPGISLTLITITAVTSFGRSQSATAVTNPKERLARYAKHTEMVQRSPFKNRPWQFLGPTNISGRVTDVAVAKSGGKPRIFFVAGASGGVWKSSDEGASWKPVFEHGVSTSIGDVTIAPSNPNIVWIGTGEANIFRSSMAGAGVYKSLDGGETWKHMGLAGTHTIPRILIHPEDPDIVYVAGSGHEWTDNPDRGVYKSADGGETWKKTLYIDAKTGAIDLVMDPSDENTLYAATWQRQRKRWNDPRNEEGHEGSGIYKSTDAGVTWAEINSGLPSARYRGRIGIDLCQAKPSTLYAFIDNYEIADTEAPQGRDSYGRARKKPIKGAEVYRSDDAGKTWAKASESNSYMRRLSATYGWVFGQIRVDPNDENVIYVMGLALNVSRDGGKTFTRLGGMHADHHALWIDPDNSSYLLNGNDGGANVSSDGGKTWRHFTDQLPMVQFFNIGHDMAKPFHVYGSIQDHGSRRAVVDISKGRSRIPAQKWEGAPGGEGSSHAIDPTDENIVYSAGFYGRISRTDLKKERRGKSIVPKAASGEPALRGQWIAPFIISPHDHETIYHGMNFLFRSRNRGDDFAKISPDLTYNDLETMGDIPFHTITAIAESSTRPGRLYVGTDDGKAHTTADGGKQWIEIMQGLAEHRWISRIEASRFHDSTLYMAQNGKRHDDFAPYLWKSADHGETWTSIVANIPLGPINVVREDPKNPNILYVGTDLGVYVSIDKGNSWQTLPRKIPTTFIHDLIIHPRDGIMVAATHGRGMYAMDIRPIRRAAKK